MKIPTLYLKWHAFQHLVSNVTNKGTGMLLYGPEDGAVRFSKLLMGDLGCAPDIARLLAKHMNERIFADQSKSTGQVVSKADPVPTFLSPLDLELPTFAFVARLLEHLPNVDDSQLERAHKQLLSDLTLTSPNDGDADLVFQKFEPTRSPVGAMPSGGPGPIVFNAGRDRGQLAIIGEPRVPVAAYTMFTRDPATIGKRIWELAWGEAILWFPIRSIPVASEGRLLLMEKPAPLQPIPGRFIVSTALAWTAKGQQKLDDELQSTRDGVPDETETGAFLTQVRRITEDKHKKWAGDVSVYTTEYIVKLP